MAHISDSIVIIPTYNEKENIEKIIRAVFGLEKCFHILVIDDGSPDGYIVSVISTGRVETRQVVGVVAEVSIHFKDVAVVTLQCPLETSDIGCAKTQLAATFQYEETIGKLLLCHHAFDDSRCAIR